MNRNNNYISDIYSLLSTNILIGVGVVISPFIVMDYSLPSDRYSGNHRTVSHPSEPGLKTTAKPSWAWPSSVFGEKLSKRLDSLDDPAEHVADCRTKNRKNDDDDNGD